MLRLLIPLIIEQILGVTIGIADTVMVASLGEAAVSSVSIVDNINLLLIQIFTSLASGGAVIAAQYIGRGDADSANDSAKQLLYTSVILTFGVMFFSLAFNKTILKFIYGGIEADVMSNAEIYYYITAVSYPFLAVYNACAAIYRAMGNSRAPMLISALMNAINICGNALFIFGAGIGVAGAAAATLISRAAGAVIMLFLICGTNNVIRIEKIFRFKFNTGMIKKVLKIGVPNGLENGMFQIGKLLVASLITTFGTASIAANAICGIVTGMALIPGSAIGIAMITVVGQCVGAKEYGQAAAYTRKLMFAMYAAMFFLNVMLFVFTRQFVDIFGLSPYAADLSSEVLKIYAVAGTLVWPISFGLPNALRAAGDAKFTMITSVISMWLFRIAFSYILIYLFRLQLHGVWIAMYIDWIFRSSVFVVRFARGKWKKLKVI